MHTDEYLDLVAQLDDEDLEAAEDAKWRLIEWGAEIVPALLTDARQMSEDGQLFAIDVAHEVASDTAGPGLMVLLASPSTEVRRAAAQALGSLRIDEAAPALAARYRVLLADGLAPQGSEATVLRWALTVLGARSGVLPARTRDLRQPVFGMEWVWPADRLPEVLADLAAHDLIVLEVQSYLQLADGSVRYTGQPGSVWRYRPDETWPSLVAESLAYHRTHTAPMSGPDTVVTIDWIDPVDVG